MSQSNWQLCRIEIKKKKDKNREENKTRIKRETKKTGEHKNTHIEVVSCCL